MKIYVGGSYSGRRRIAEEISQTKWREEVVILNQWQDDEFFVEKAWDNDLGGNVAEVMARLDESEVRDADLVIIDTVDRSSTGGSDTELGLARSLGKRIVHIGPYRNIFQTLADTHYASWDEFRINEARRGRPVEGLNV